MFPKQFVRLFKTVFLLIFVVSCEEEEFIGYTGKFKDNRDGQVYKWVKIGKQIRMAYPYRFGMGNSTGLPWRKVCCLRENERKKYNTLTLSEFRGNECKRFHGIAGRVPDQQWQLQ